MPEQSWENSQGGSKGLSWLCSRLRVSLGILSPAGHVSLLHTRCRWAHAEPVMQTSLGYLTAKSRSFSITPHRQLTTSQTCYSLSLGMVNPQIRLVQAAWVPFSSSPFYPPQSHTRAASGHCWLMVSCLSLSLPGSTLDLRSKRLENTFLESFKAGLFCFLPAECFLNLSPILKQIIKERNLSAFLNFILFHIFE